MSQFIFSAAFMTACYSRRGETKARDAVLAPLLGLVCGLGLTPEDVLQRHAKYEFAWFELFKE